MKYVFILLILLNAHTLNAIELDLGVGYTHTKKPANGLWWQDPFENDMQTDSPSGHIGLRFNTTDNINILVGLKYLGKFKTYAKASASDRNYADWQEGKAEIWPLSTWKGEGKAYGLYGLIEYEFKYFHITAGYWVHKVTWEMTVPDWRCAAIEVNGECGGSPAHTYYSEPKYKKVHQKSIWELGYIYGIGKKFGNVSIDLEVWDIKAGEGPYPPTFSGPSKNLSITYIF